MVRFKDVTRVGLVLALCFGFAGIGNAGTNEEKSNEGRDVRLIYNSGDKMTTVKEGTPWDMKMVLPDYDCKYVESDILPKGGFECKHKTRGTVKYISKVEFSERITGMHVTLTEVYPDL